MINLNMKAATRAGLVAGIAYLATAEIDNRLTGQNYDLRELPDCQST